MERGAAAAAAAVLGCALRSPSPSPSRAPQWRPLLRSRRGPPGAPLSLLPPARRFSQNFRLLDMKTFSSSGHPGVSLNNDLVNDKLLIDCGEDQDCVLGGIVALGKFDALHIGHRELAMHASKAGTPFLLSFVGMAEVLGWTYRPPIVAQCDRKRVLSSWAPYCRNVAPLEYQVEFSKVRYLTPRQFVERLSKDLRIKGENYRFGYKASGDAAELVKLCEEFGLSAFIVRSVMDTAKRSHNGVAATINSSDKGQVSSSRVRHALAMGDMEYVSDLLGRKHRLVLTVNEDCLHEGKKIIFPSSCTLNMPPAEGLYENCDIVNGGYLGPCRVIINSDTTVVEMKDENSLSPNPIQEVGQLSIEFG
ncbi:FAD synthetase, chloroplastic-like isoform X3 [Phragmites australis]|uniref:FAD synthetase, chloroplastic-like isoform X3 n=1 Tax=Phragmites australis TaxID=29695 RepID=UPI002D78ED07|nr:FAD synthetase, chloroplastic-like isoform X3 [Phragmites australis]